ncbi:MAG TPA: HYR domain-containing protein [Saprospiraceae bacterium]|nr:HYR domain-containing protein [Saprospiraceae bacterium]
MAISGNNYYFDNNAGNCNSNFLVENACGSSNAFSITCPDSIYTVIPVGSDSVAINWDDPVVNTTCTTGNITLTSSMPNGSLLGVGEYTITYQATDGCNQSGSCSFVVNVGDSPAVLNMSVLNCPDA